MGIKSSWDGSSREDGLFNKTAEEAGDLTVSDVLNKGSSLCLS